MCILSFIPNPKKLSFLLTYNEIQILYLRLLQKCLLNLNYLCLSLNTKCKIVIPNTTKINLLKNIYLNF